MSENNVLKADKITRILDEYRKNIGEPSNQGDHRPFFKEALERFFDHHDEFYSETSLKTGLIAWSYGLNSWMGHEDLQAGVDRNDVLVQYVHPLVRDWYKYMVLALTAVFTERSVHYLSSRFCISVPMKDQRGNYHLVKQMAMVFGKDKDQKVVSYINSFSIFGPYFGENLNPQFFEGKNKVDAKEDKVIRLRLAELLDPCIEIDPDSGFSLSRDDFAVLDIIRDLRNEGKTRNVRSIKRRFVTKRGDIASEQAVTQRLKRIHKALKWIMKLDKDVPEEYSKDKNKKFMPALKDVYELADFLDQSGILFVIRQYLQKRGYPKAKKKQKR
jgi:hypothetical protein